MLYTWEVGRCGADEAIAGHAGFSDQDGPLGDEALAFAGMLVRGTIAGQADLDRLIEHHAEHWRLPRMAAIDRLILRLATFELTSAAGTPAAVVIDEAIELARRFSEGDAVKFVNGVLDAIYKAGPALPRNGA